MEEEEMTIVWLWECSSSIPRTCAERNWLKTKRRLVYFPPRTISWGHAKAVCQAYVIAQHFMMGVNSAVLGPLSPSKDMSIFIWTVKITQLFPHRKVVSVCDITKAGTTFVVKSCMVVITFLSWSYTTFLLGIISCPLNDVLARLQIMVSFQSAKEWHMTWARPIWPTFLGLWFIATWGWKKRSELLHSSCWVIPAFRHPNIPLPPPNCLGPEPDSPVFPLILWATSNILAKRFFPASVSELVSVACYIHLTSTLFHKIIGCLSCEKSYRSFGQCPHFTAEEIEAPRG